MSSEKPTLIGERYKILHSLGEDKIGPVSLAKDEVAGGEVVLRALSPEIIADTATIEKLGKEIARLNGLEHEGIVSSYDLCCLRDPGAAFLVCEHIDGQTLRELLSNNPESFREENRFRALAEQILSAVDYAHRRGITHRDLTLDNVLLTPDDRIKILDFGIDAMIDESHPEARKKMSWASRKLSATGMDAERAVPIDIHSLGRLFREMLLGESESSEARQEEAPLPISGTSAGLNSLIFSCLSKESSQRPKTVKEILDQLLDGRVQQSERNDHALADLRAEKPPPLAGTEEGEANIPVESSGGKWRRRAGLIVLILLALALLLVWQWPQYIRERTGAQIREEVRSGATPGRLASGKKASDSPLSKEPLRPDGGELVGSSVQPGGSRPPEAVPGESPGRAVESQRSSNTLTPPPGGAGGATDVIESPTRSSTRTTGGYTLQVGAFGLSKSAQDLTSRLRDRGYEARIQEPGGGNKYYLVWIGEYESVAAASQTQKRLESAGFHTYVRRVEPVRPE